MQLQSYRNVCIILELESCNFHLFIRFAGVATFSREKKLASSRLATSDLSRFNDYSVKELSSAFSILRMFHFLQLLKNDRNGFTVDKKLHSRLKSVKSPMPKGNFPDLEFVNEDF